MAQAFPVANLNLQQVQGQIQLCNQRIQIFTTILQQLAPFAHQPQHQQLIQNYQIQLQNWKNYKTALILRELELI